MTMLGEHPADTGFTCIAQSAAGAGSRQQVAMETHYHVKAFDPDGNLKWEDDAYNRVVTVGLNKLLDATFKTGLATPAWYIGIVGPSITNVSVTSGSTVIGSVSAPWQAVDEGRAIILRGAAGAGADLVTTISTVTTSSGISIAVAATTSLTNVNVLWDARSTDTSTAHTPWTESSAYSTSRPAFTPGTVAAGSVDNSASPASFSITVNNTLIGGLMLNNSSSVNVGTSTDILYGMAPFSSVGFRQLNSGDTLQVTATLTAASV